MRQLQQRITNEAVKAAKKETEKVIKDALALKGKDIKSGMRAKRANGYANEGMLTIYPVPISLEKFPLKQTDQGLSGTVEKSKGTVLISHAFFREIQGKKQAFIRTRKINTSSSQFVFKPAGGPPRRGPKGSELPINKLLADPKTFIIEPKAQQIIQKAADEAAIKGIQLIDQALDTGKV